jgi:glycosyltransferase involved in cell wall biosynthesis
VAHNIEADIWRRYYEHEHNPLKRFYIGHQLRKVRRFERECFTWADGATAVTAGDASVINAFAVSYRALVVENGVDTDYFRPRSADVEPTTLVFTGSMDYRPNQDAAEYFCSDILPLLSRTASEFHVYFVGRNPPAHIRELEQRHNGIHVTGTVDDVRPYIAKSAVYIVPLRVGGGSRLKILEAMSMEKAVVSTHVGAEGLDVTDGENIVLAGTVEEFAERIAALMSDRARRAMFGRNGRKLVLSKYRWETVGANLTRYLNEIIAS